MNKPTIEATGARAREIIKRGVNRVYETTKKMLGPNSETFLAYGTYGREPRIFDDGHWGAQVIEPKNELENLVVRVFRETAAKTNELVGDGTNTTMVIAGKLINELLVSASVSEKSLASQASFNPQAVKRELLNFSKAVQEKIKEKSIKIEKLEDLEKVANISVGDAELGKTIAKICYEVGVDGFVDVVEGYKGELETEVIKGARFPAKPGAKAFVNNPKRFEMVAEDCSVLLTNYKLDNSLQLRGGISKFLGPGEGMVKKLVIFAPEFSEDVLMSILQTCRIPLSKEQGGGFRTTGLDIYPVKVPSLRTEQFEDLAVYFGANFINKDTGKKLENVSVSDLGFVGKLVIKDTENREDAMAIGGGGTREEKMKIDDKEYGVTSKVSERIKVLKEQMDETRQPQFKKLLERRIASLGSAVGVIRVGASSRAEAFPMKMKIEDAVYACRAALEEGYVKGGGICLKEIAESMERNILTEALKAPYNQIQENAGGFLEIGEDVIDPAKAVRLEVENAVSVAANLITVGTIVAEISEDSPAEGYKSIAKAINIGNILQNKKEKLIAENELEAEMDMERSLEYKLMQDNG